MAAKAGLLAKQRNATKGKRKLREEELDQDDRTRGLSPAEVTERGTLFADELNAAVEAEMPIEVEMPVEEVDKKAPQAGTPLEELANEATEAEKQAQLDLPADRSNKAVKARTPFLLDLLVEQAGNLPGPKQLRGQQLLGEKEVRSACCWTWASTSKGEASLSSHPLRSCRLSRAVTPSQTPRPRPPSSGGPTAARWWST